jgi:hypothetical protein
MPKSFDQWTVLPHGALETLDDDLLTVEGDLPMPLVMFPRRMTVVRLHDGRLVIFSAIALAEPVMKELEAFGRPSFLIVPNDIHRLDAPAWKRRYPELTVVCPPGVREKVEEVVHVDAVSLDVSDDRLRFVTVPGTAEREAALVFETASGTTLIVNDLIWSVANLPGLGGWLFRIAGLTGPGARVVLPVRLKLIKDKPAVSNQLSEWADLPKLQRLLVSHGTVVSEDVPGVLRRLAQSLYA